MHAPAVFAHALLGRASALAHLGTAFQSPHEVVRVLASRGKELLQRLNALLHLLPSLVVVHSRLQAGIGIPQLFEGQQQALCQARGKLLLPAHLQLIQPPGKTACRGDHLLQQVGKAGLLAKALEGVFPQEQRVVLGARYLLKLKHLVNGLLQQILRIFFVQHLEPWIQTQVQRRCMEDARAHAVDGGNPGIVHLACLLEQALRPQGGAHPSLQLRRRLFREGDGADLIYIVDPRVGLDQGAGDALGQGEGLAAARTCGNIHGADQALDASFLLRRVVNGHFPSPSYAWIRFGQLTAGQYAHASLVRGRGSTSPALMRASTAASFSSTWSRMSSKGSGSHAPPPISRRS